ncbi:MAG: alpha/beta hydrolase [Gemmatimonadaceae bacterium]|jgi:pimeloyl-ACP methyl ester carboxylesterase|nr:alpha/beta hydrolase [Gemmatimonadaceae bacterium]
MSPVLAVDDVLLGFDESGSPSGHPVLYVHGFPHTRALWRHQLQGLPPLVRGLAPDLRGFGVSQGPPARRIDDHVDDLLRLLDQLGIDRVTVCGCSMGGYIAFALWRRAALRVRALVLADTRMGADTPEARARRSALIEVAERKGAAAIAELLLPGMTGTTTARDRPELVETVRAMMRAQSPAAIVDALIALRDRADSAETLGTITVPTLVVVGSEDTLTPPSESEQMVSRLTRAPLARLEVVHGAGHIPCVERPAAFNCVLAEFLAGVIATDD